MCADGTIMDSFALQNFQIKFSLCENTLICIEDTTPFAMKSQHRLRSNIIYEVT